jgi:ribulose-phosphate 3-epimerase
LNSNKIVSVSVLSADFSNLVEVCEVVEKSGAEWLHFDVMDGVFVNNITFGCPLLKAINSHSNLVNDVHLMIVDPIKYVEDFAKSGADYITFHYESDSNPLDTIKKIRECGVKVGIPIKPNTPVSEIRDLIGLVDLVLIMTVEPGFGGQGFIYDTLPKVEEVRKIIDDNGYNALIEVDGGINQETAKLVNQAGVDVLVSGSYLFKQSNMADGVNALKH